MSGLTFSLLLPMPVLIALATIGLIICFYTALRLPVSGFCRLIAVTALLVLLAGPRLLEQTTSPLPDIALIIKDESASQSIDGRREVTDQAFDELYGRLSNIAGLEVRTVSATGRAETRLSDAFFDGLADIPRSQLAGIFVLTDGQSVETPESPGALGISAPVHAFLTGRDDEKDRVLEVISAPRFGIINETAEINFRVSDYGTNARLANITLKINGRVAVNRAVRVGEDIPVRAKLDRPGKTILELIVQPIEGELTTRNNRAVIEISVIRDRLRVLLVSGEPHAGERVWRNLLKSDPAVDLIHFTILKPATKPRVAAEEDLALIRFPENELFLEKLDQFDVLIFDRYTYRGVMSPLHFDNISRYIQNGGAMLIASGPEFIGSTSIAGRRNLAFILPAVPSGDVHNTPFVPLISETGARHPVTDSLDDTNDWGRWVRSLGVYQRGGQVLMERDGGEPILIVDRVGQGRVGLLLSDHVWLWAREFDGGGPHRELLRRLVHWLMKEPELEEEAINLSSKADSEQITMARRTLGETVMPVAIEAPDGTISNVSLEEVDNGRWVGQLLVSEPGLYTATTEAADGRILFDVAALGLATPPEYREVITTTEHVASLVATTGGGIYSVRTESGVRVPAMRQVRVGRPTSGRGADSGWAGVLQRDAVKVESVSTRDILAPWGWLLMIAVALLASWFFEAGQRGLFKRGR